MNILVTGGNGQLGRSLHKISPEYPQHDFFFTDMPEADITDRERMDSLIRDKSIGTIINCAAYTAVDKAESDALSARRINAEGPRILAEAAREASARLIHISTDYVFSGEGCHPLKEDDPTGPTGVYGRTKLAGEQAVAASGCRAAIIRTAWLYSEFGNNFVKTMLRLGAERDSLRVVYDQIGSPTYATDLARAVMSVCENETGGCALYHFSNEGVISWFDFTKAIFELSGIEIPVEPIESSEFPAPARRPAYSVLSKERIRRTGVAVPYWRDSLKACLEILKKSRDV